MKARAPALVHEPERIAPAAEAVRIVVIRIRVPALARVRRLRPARLARGDVGLEARLRRAAHTGDVGETASIWISVLPLALTAVSTRLVVLRQRVLDRLGEVGRDFNCGRALLQLVVAHSTSIIATLCDPS